MKNKSKISAIFLAILFIFSSSIFAEKDYNSIRTKSERGILKYLGSYKTDLKDITDGGIAEIVSFNPKKSYFYLVSGQVQRIDIVKINSDGSCSVIKKLDLNKLITDKNINIGDITSLCYNEKADKVAVAIQHSEYDKNGYIAILDSEGNYLYHTEAGVQPDMVIITPDGKYALSANEGEPRKGYGEGVKDPEGSVTILDIKSKKAKTLGFKDISRDEAIKNNVLIKKGSEPSADFEPEYIAISEDSSTAYVSLQENNSVASLDIKSGTWNYVKGLGFKDHSLEGQGLDLNRDKKINIKPEKEVFGVYLPDGIAFKNIQGKGYILTANEGDAREWGEKENEYLNIQEEKVNDSKKKVEFLLNDSADGLPKDGVYMLGGRSFSIWDAENLKQVYDSKEDFERITARMFPEFFNSGHDESSFEKRSNKKGSEPESVAILRDGERTYAVIGLERIGGIMLYDISEPENSKYVDYLNPRAFNEIKADEDENKDAFKKEMAKRIEQNADLGAEGIATIEAKDSPTGNPLILVANEISGTVTIAEIDMKSSENSSEDYKNHWALESIRKSIVQFLNNLGN